MYIQLFLLHLSYNQLKTPHTMLKHKNIESFLPVFNGFYNTLFEPNEEEVIEEPFTYDNYTFDYAGYRTDVSKECVGVIENELKHIGIDVTITYQSLYSPKEYNFTSDSINVKYKVKNPKQINDYLLANIEAFTAYIKRKYTSYDGFSSFWSNDAKVWLKDHLNNKKDLNHTFGAILDFIFENEGYNVSDLYDSVQGNVCLNGTLNPCVQEAMDTIVEYANENYKNKDSETIVIELTQLFDTMGIFEDFLTFKYISNIVNQIFAEIDNKTINLFK